MTPEVLADPVGTTVTLILQHEPALGREVTEGIVTAVAGGRAKQRKLAQALVDNPALLAGGRSPAPRAAGDLLIALRAAGAGAISAPVCAECGKPLRSLQRRGEDWYCGPCGRPREPCAGCGNLRPVRIRDRHGQPRCGTCPLEDGADPVSMVTAVVTAIDPAMPAETVAAAVRAAVPVAGRRHQLAWAVQDRPELLTGAGAQTPVPSVLRLIDELRRAGAAGITRPPCPHCGRVITLVKPRDGVRLCRNCVARSRAEPCTRCGAVREAATRDEHRRPLCPDCLVKDPANHEDCAGCGRRRPVAARGPGGPLCGTCRPWQVLTCGICGRRAPCQISRTTGKPWCRACKQRWAPCDRCGEVRPVRGGSADAPLCAACTRPEPGFWRSCPGCGQPGRLHVGRCARCNLERRLRELLGSQNGEIRPGLQDLYQALLAVERTGTIETWLSRSAAPAILRDLQGGNRPLTHETLDELPAGKAVEHLRSVLVSVGTLPVRDEQMSRLERWVPWVIAERPDPAQQQLLHRYAVWHVIRRLRTRLAGSHATRSQVVAARRNIKAAAAMLDWLTARDLSLATARQADLEAWLISSYATYRGEAGNFIRWARRHKLTSLDYAAIRWGGPSGVIDTENRWEQARWLLHDDTVKPEDRVAGLLVLLYAQRPMTISRLTLSHVQNSDGAVNIRLGREPIVLPSPLDTLVLQLTAARHGHAAIGDQGTSPWLFPGGQPGQPISADQLRERLHQLGLRPGQARTAALFQLATDLPAAVLARLLGIHIAVAVAWQRAAAGDWASYAAEVSRRATTTETGDHDFSPA